MVSILPPKRGFVNAIGDAMSEFGRNAPQLLEERYQNQRGLSAIDQTQNKSLERSGLGQKSLELAQNIQAQKIKRPGEEETFQAPPKQNLPGFIQQPGQENQPQENQFFPSNQPGGQGPGHLAQTATTGKVVPLLTPTQKIAEKKRLHKEYADLGMPNVTFQQVSEEVNAAEEDKKLHNLELMSFQMQRQKCKLFLRKKVKNMQEVKKVKAKLI